MEAGPEQPDVSVVPGLSTVLVSSNIAWSYTSEPNGKSCLAYPEGRCFIGRSITYKNVFASPSITRESNTISQTIFTITFKIKYFILVVKPWEVPAQSIPWHI